MMDKIELEQHIKLRELVKQNPKLEFLYKYDDDLSLEVPNAIVIHDCWVDGYSTNEPDILLYSQSFEEIKALCMSEKTMHSGIASREIMQSYEEECGNEYVWTDCIVIDLDWKE